MGRAPACDVGKVGGGVKFVETIAIGGVQWEGGVVWCGISKLNHNVAVPGDLNAYQLFLVA